MSTDDITASTDLIRWTFTVPDEAATAVESHLTDLGADVFTRNGVSFHVTWDEPEVDLDPVVEAIWSLAGMAFEITQEEFHRLELHILHRVEERTVSDEPAAHTASEEFHPGFDSLEVMDL